MNQLPIIINDGKIPIKMWANDAEKGALEQAKNASNHPFSFHHIALMPDVHEGYGACIGEVAAMEQVIVPNIIGKDIGCGMRAVKTSIKANEIIPVIKDIMSEIRLNIPVGFNHRPNSAENRLPKIERTYFEQSNIIKEEWDSASYQIGSLGGGNHFWESQKDNDNNVWIMLHSGSRNIGNKIADYYDKLAKKLNEEWSWDIKVPSSWQLNFLPMYGKNKKYGESYYREMNWALEFAKANRQFMMDLTKEVFIKYIPDITFNEDLDIHHNFAAWENHFGQNVIVHRKGATRSKTGEIGIIPGSQGTSSYIVRGFGNPESFMSCSHGAGRALSRTLARNSLNLEEEKSKLDKKGIIHSIRNVDDLDEASGAYKDIDEVIESEKDLIEVVERLQPIAVIKG